MKEKHRSDFLTRQKMIRSNFELYYYSDTGGVQVTPHIHDNFEVQFFLEGDVKCFINGQEKTLSPHDVIIIPPKARHFNRIGPDKPYRRFIFWISREYLDAMIATSRDYGYFARLAQEKDKYFWSLSQASFSSLQARMIALLESMNGKAFGREPRLQLDSASLVLLLNEIIYAMEHPYSGRENRNLNGQVLDYIQGHLDEDLSLEKLSQVFFVSKYHISHLFKNEMGISLHQYVIKKRLERVRNSILADEDLTEALDNAGFGNYSSFFRAFQKEYGMSPTEYKKLRSLESLDQNK